MICGNQLVFLGVIFMDQMRVYLGDVEVCVYYMGEGYINGDLVIYFFDLCMVYGGDLLYGIVLFIDYVNGGNSVFWVDMVIGILQLNFDIVIFGYGGFMIWDDVRVFCNQMIVVWECMSMFISNGVIKENVVV